MCGIRLRNSIVPEGRAECTWKVRDGDHYKESKRFDNWDTNISVTLMVS